MNTSNLAHPSFEQLHFSLVLTIATHPRYVHCRILWVIIVDVEPWDSTIPVLNLAPLRTTRGSRTPAPNPRKLEELLNFEQAIRTMRDVAKMRKSDEMLYMYTHNVTCPVRGQCMDLNHGLTYLHVCLPVLVRQNGLH